MLLWPEVFIVTFLTARILISSLEFGISYRRQQKMQQTFQLLSIILIQQTLVAANAVLVLNDSFKDMLYFYRFLILYF